MTQFRPTETNGNPVPYDATIDELREGLKEAGPVAWAAFVALSRIPGSDSLQLLSAAASSPDWRYRRCAVEAISGHVLTSGTTSLILGALEDQNQYVVITACRAVAHHWISQAHGSLTRLLAHLEPAVREAAVTALASIWLPLNFELVKRLHIADPSREVRRAAAYALVQNVTKETWRELFNLWQGSDMGRYRLWAVLLAHQHGGEEAGRLLNSFQNDKDGHVRKAAAS